MLEQIKIVFSVITSFVIWWTLITINYGYLELKNIKYGNFEILLFILISITAMYIGYLLINKG